MGGGLVVGVSARSGDFGVVITDDFGTNTGALMAWTERVVAAGMSDGCLAAGEMGLWHFDVTRDLTRRCPEGGSIDTPCPGTCSVCNGSGGVSSSSSSRLGGQLPVDDNVSTLALDRV